MLNLCGALGALGSQSLAAGARGEAERGLYLLCYDPKLQPAAEAWAAYRAGEGWQVVTTPVMTGDDPAQQREALREVIGGHSQRVVAVSGHASPLSPQSSVLSPSSPRIAVLLLGDADAIAPWSFPQTDPTLRSQREGRYITDNPYQDVDGDGRPDVALGRVPARTNEEALIALDKVRRYEANRAPGSWRRRIAYVAGEGRFGPFDGLLEQLFKQMVARLVPEAFEVSMTYAHPESPYCPPPSRLTKIVLEQLGGERHDGGGALLFNYVGHGHATALDQLDWNGRQWPILRSTDLDGLSAQGTANANGALPIALLTCCSAGWFDLADGRRSLAEAMLFHPAGPVAVIAGSRMTHPYANALVQKNLTRGLLAEEMSDLPSLGEIELQASRALIEAGDESDLHLDLVTRPIAMALGWTSSLAALRAMHVELYNLLGDPALRVARPAATFTDVRFVDDELRGTVRGMREGLLRVELCAGRTAMASEEDLLAVEGEADAELERKAAHNYAIANQRVLGVLHAEVREGAFALRLPAGAMTGAVAALRLVAEGTSGAGEAVDAYAGLALSTPSGSAVTVGDAVEAAP